MKSPVSIALFFLLSAFLLFALLAALEHSRKSLGIAAACLVATVCIIVLLVPLRVPHWWPFIERVGPQRQIEVVTTTTMLAPTTTCGGTTTTCAVTTTVAGASGVAASTTTSLTSTTSAGAVR